jgi:hypothetical protein
MQTITSQITRHLNNHIILCGNFNRDIALVGHMQGSNIILPQQQDHQWKLFTQNLGLTYIPTNTSYTRQGGLNYTHTSLLDGYYIKSPTHITYTSQTNTDFPHNSDHFPVSLFLPNNIILARPPPTPPLLNSRLLNPIPQKTLDLFNLTFFTRAMAWYGYPLRCVSLCVTYVSLILCMLEIPCLTRYIQLQPCPYNTIQFL